MSSNPLVIVPTLSLPLPKVPYNKVVFLYMRRTNQGLKLAQTLKV